MQKVMPFLALSCALVFSNTGISVYGQPAAGTSPPVTKTSAAGNTKSDGLRYVLFENAKQNYGYDILDHDHKMIHQSSIPGRPGNKGFASKQEAEKVARLVIQKIRGNIMPPSVSEKELNALHITL